MCCDSYFPYIFCIYALHSGREGGIRALTNSRFCDNDIIHLSKYAAQEIFGGGVDIIRY